jgi:dTDP-4-dehydrorhamnose reductase
MKVLILGGTGLLGKALMRAWNRDQVMGDQVSGDQVHADEVLALGSRDGDIRDPQRVRGIVNTTQPDWIVLVAAYTDVDGCESNQDLAFSVNRDGAVHVARAAKEAGARLLFLSSDYVFDGRKTSPYETDDPRNPQSVYGRSKAEAELRLLDVMPDCCIVRTSWLFGVDGKCFPDTILKLAASRSTLDVVNDQRGCPTYAADLADTIIRLCHANASGIVHATNTGDCTWFDFAGEIMRASGLGTEVRPVNSAQMARPAPRPAYSVLSPASLRRLGITTPAWQDALRRYLQARG